MRVIYEPSATLELQLLPEQVGTRIVNKMRFFADQVQPLSFAKRLVGRQGYRFRIGDYRVICDIEQDTIIVLAIGKRDDIYRDL